MYKASGYSAKRVMHNDAMTFWYRCSSRIQIQHECTYLTYLHHKTATQIHQYQNNNCPTACLEPNLADSDLHTTL